MSTSSILNEEVVTVRIRPRSTITTTALVLTVASTGLTACGSPTASSGGAPHAGGSVTIVENTEQWKSLDPGARQVTPAKGMLAAIYDTLFTLTAEGAVQPELASGYTTSPDGLTWTITLRPNVLFSDGTPFDAAAVKFNLERQVSPSQHAGEGSYLPSDLTADAPDAHTVVIHLRQPFAPLATNLATHAVGMIASPAAVRKWGAEYGLHPVGAGPFTLQSQVVGQTATLVKNPHYWQPGRPYLDSVTWRVVSSADSALATVTSGGAQVMEQVRPLQASQASGAANLDVVSTPALTQSFVSFNTTKAPFNDVRARRAIASAIDQQTISAKLYNGLFKPSESMVGPGSWAYPGPHVQGYPEFDIAQAKQLNDQVGGLSFTLIAQNTPDQQQLAQALQQQFAAAGIKVTIKPEEDVQMIGEWFSHNYTAMLFDFPGSVDPDSVTRTMFESTSSNNPTGISDPQLDGLLKQGLQAQAQSARKAIYDQVSQRLAQLVPFAFVVGLPKITVLDKKVHGVPKVPWDGTFLTDAWLS